ncbi:PAS domain-containing protein [bacterium]|nr:MAG: PAS domain-containing protein [bacterium]
MGNMKTDFSEKLRSLAKDSAAFEELVKLFETLESENRQKQEHLQLLEKAIGNDYDSILITDLQLDNSGPKIVYVNNGFTKLTGYTREEVIGKTPRILQGPKTDRTTLNKLVSDLKEGKSFFGQAINYRKDGSEFINQWDIHPLYNDSGEITHWVSYQHDITRRKNAETVFNETEVEFDNLMEYSKRILVDIKPDGTIIQANKAFRALSGFEKAQLEEKDFSMLLSAESQSVFSDDLLNSPSKGHAHLELLSENRQFIHVEVQAEVHQLDSGDFIRLTFQNVSMQKKILETLEHRLFAENTLIGSKNEFSYELEFDANDTPMFSYLSDGFASLTGFSKTEFLHSKTIQKLFGNDLNLVTHQWNHVKNGLDKVETVQITKNDGNQIPVLHYAQLNLSAKEKGKIRISGSMVLQEN